ncbi:MAG: hypothetical protein ACYTG6_08155, partial [Planctomycetota bacterium]
MRRHRFLPTLVFCAALVIFAPAWSGADSLVGREAPPLGVGSWVVPTEGPDVSFLRGKVALIAYAAPGAPDRDERIRRLSELHLVYEPQGLRIVYVGHGERDAVAAFVRDRGITFPVGVLAGGDSPYGAGPEPRAWLVAPDGTVAWEGAPEAVPLDLLERLLRNTKDFFVRPVCEEANAVRLAVVRGRLAEAEQLIRHLQMLDAVPDVARDVDYVSNRISGIRAYWEGQVEAGTNARAFSQVMDQLSRLAKHYKDTETAARATELRTTLNRDPGVQREVDAARAYERLFRDWRRAEGNARRERDLEKNLVRFLEKHPGSRPAEYASRVLASLQEDPAMEQIRSFIEKERVDTSRSGWRTSLSMPPSLTFDDEKAYFWNLETNMGPIKIRLLPDVAPMHVSSTIYLTELGFYD